MAFIGRLFVILFALLLAAVATAMVATFALLVCAFQQLSADPFEHVMFWGLALFASGAAAVTAFLPTLVAIALAEAFRIRSALVYALAGGAIMLLGFYGAGFASGYDESIDHPPPPISREAEIAAACGVAFGLIYWTIAGRRAGAWRKSSS
jgi:hypothetical protein